MPSNKLEQVYCSVDLEFTGFDPSRDQILEIGFAFFTMSENGAVITEQWSQVFKPSIEVHPKILGLTGITQEELDAAPEFAEHCEFLQEKLGDAIIVGHNPVMDVKFLEAYGIKLSGKTIDTLELVQFILPTHHSYNLENLVHYFGVKHSIAHRALGDALSTISVLENLTHVYNSFTAELKKELQTVFKRGEFLWENILDIKLTAKEISSNDSLKHNASTLGLNPLEISDKLIILDDSQSDLEVRAALGLKQKNTSSVLAVSDSSIVMRLWQDGLVHGQFRKEDTFSKTAFDKFMSQAEDMEQLRFCLKIIVWLHTNWQTEVVFDLNISFFGGQFRQFIVGGEMPIKDDEQVLCLDYTTLQSLSHSERKTIFKDRGLLVCGIQSFEKYISAGFGTRLGWSSVLYSLRMIYNPETDFGNLDLKEQVLAALTGTDLFFSLTYMLLSRSFSANQYVSLSDLNSTHPSLYNRLQKAADNLLGKLNLVAAAEPTPELNRTINFLGSFFDEREGRVKWITLDETNLSLHDQPINISDDVNGIFKLFSSVQFTETIAEPELLSYLVDRLGLHTEQSEFVKEIKNKHFEFTFYHGQLNDGKLYELVAAEHYPLIAVFSAAANIKSFYNSFYPQLKEKAALFAQGYSGGGNKMFRNFSIREESILLITAEFMAKQNYVIPAKTIVFTAPPQIETKHPYIAALLAKWQDKYPKLENILAYAKVSAALKKIKANDKISVHLFNFEIESGKKTFFVDNSR